MSTRKPTHLEWLTFRSTIVHVVHQSDDWHASHFDWRLAHDAADKVLAFADRIRRERAEQEAK